MEDSFLLEMLEAAIKDAADTLFGSDSFEPFAKLLKSDNSVMHFESDFEDEIQAYDALTEQLKTELQGGNIKAVILLQECPLPQHFNLDVQRSIRVHVESNESLSEKLGARFLYVPYEKESEEGIKLFHPKPVAFSHEIFKV